MKKWDILHTTINSSQLTIDSILQILLSNRGLKTEAEANIFFYPKLEDVTIQNVGIDEEQVAKAIARVKKAIDKQEQIVIYGDYDVDGITSSAILWETFHAAGARVIPYVPHRVDEGYGLSIKGIENILSGRRDEHVKHDLRDTKLIITVDNGIVANAAVDFANKNGIDVIITDHHVQSESLPNAFAIVHTTKLCGAGVAYLLAKQFKVQSEKFKVGEDTHLELAALGTIADLVPLQGANRIIVKYGLQKLCKTRRPGLLELFKESGCDAGSIGVYEVGHIIAPRLNATGRMASGMDSLRLLCTRDRQRAEELAGLLGTTNRERQSVMQEATKDAISNVKFQMSNFKEGEKLKKLLIAVHEDYPEGVIGLVAGRIVEEFYRPAIVISKGDKVSKGSVRSISGFNIIEFLRNSSDFFVNVGGHPMAAGFTIETDKIAQMKEQLEKLAEAISEDIFIRTLRVDCEVPLTLATDRLYTAIQTLGPFGMANPEPTFVTRQVKVDDMKILGREGKHLKLFVSAQNAVMEAIAFGMGEHAKDLKQGDHIDLAYTVDENNWNGRRKLQLKVRDFQKA